MTNRMVRDVVEGRMAFDAPFIPWGDTQRRVLRFTCASCSATHDTPISTNEFPPAELALKKPRRAGWQVHETRRTEIRCPACQRQAKPRQALAAIATEPTSPKPEHPAQAQPQEHEAPMSKPTPPASTGFTSQIVNTSGAVAQHATTQRDPTYDERMRIRRILEECFDDKAGQWLEGLDDKKAGEKINVPWALVTRIREAAYGPIRVDAELVAIRQEMDAIDQGIIALSARAAELMQRHAALAKRIEARGA